MNIVIAEKNAQQKIEEVKQHLEQCREQFVKGEVDFKVYHQQEIDLLSSLEKLFISKNTQGLVF